MAEAGLLAPLASYRDIARIKAALVERTGLLGVGGIWGGRQMVGRWFIEGFGTPAQKTAWLGKTAAVSISEPNVGAHPKHLTTRAVHDGTMWRITGEKAWTSNGPIADVLIVLAITSETEGRKQYSMFLVPRDTPGLTLKDMPGFHALRPSRHCQVVLDDCAVPGSALLGPPGRAYDHMALPFRDVEDVVGTFGVLGAFRFLLRQFRAEGDTDNQRALWLGGLVALTSVYGAAAEFGGRAVGQRNYRHGLGHVGRSAAVRGGDPASDARPRRQIQRRERRRGGDVTGRHRSHLRRRPRSKAGSPGKAGDVRVGIDIKPP